MPPENNDGETKGENTPPSGDSEHRDSNGSTKTSTDPDYERVSANADKMIRNRGGGIEGARGAIIKLLYDNKEQRERMKTLRARAVDDGAEVLRGKDLAAWRAFQKLELTPEQLDAKLKSVDELSGKVKGLENERYVDQVAGLMDFSDNGRVVFSQLAKLYGLELKIDEVEEEREGEKVKVKKPFARVLGPDGKGEFRTVDMYLDNELKEFKPALYADADADVGTDTPGTGARHTTPERKVTPMPRQSSSQRTTREPVTRTAVASVMGRNYSHSTAKPEK
jgi:hypothetical protein